MTGSLYVGCAEPLDFGFDRGLVGEIWQKLQKLGHLCLKYKNNDSKKEIYMQKTAF
jgi:hypothetical protein